MNIGFVDLFVQTTADGTAAPVFPGGATVEGATPIPTLLPTALSHAVSWTRGPGGALIGQLVGAYNDDPPFNTAEMILGVQSPTGAGSAAMSLQADDTGNGSIMLNVPGAGALTLINNAAQSNFLQLAAPQRLAANIGVATLTWPGASLSSNFPSIAHGLPRTPQGVWTQPVGGLPGTVFAVATAFAYTPTQFTMQAVTHNSSAPVAGTAISVVWLAIG